MTLVKVTWVTSWNLFQLLNKVPHTSFTWKMLVILTETRMLANVASKPRPECVKTPGACVCVCVCVCVRVCTCV